MTRCPVRWRSPFFGAVQCWHEDDSDSPEPHTRHESWASRKDRRQHRPPSFIVLDLKRLPALIKAGDLPGWLMLDQTLEAIRSQADSQPPREIIRRDEYGEPYVVQRGNLEYFVWDPRQSVGRRGLRPSKTRGKRA